MAAKRETKNASHNAKGRDLSVAGLFAGIAGIERGLEAAGHHGKLLNEIDPYAQAVLQTHYPNTELVGDVRDVRHLPRVDLVAAGFPCQDLSQAGQTRGINGKNSGLVGEVFRLIENPKKSPDWVLLENVPFMLRLDRGEAMHYLTDRLDEMGFVWAYRVIDTRAFGLPQRRKRVVLLASRLHDPREVLFVGSEQPSEPEANGKTAYGFYWTEGTRGLGWGVSCVPTLKGGSGIGIASPPAIWMPDGRLVTPDIRDAERLQGFPVDWTAPAQEVEGARKGARWKLVGNAVSVPLSEWVGNRLRDPQRYDAAADEMLQAGDSWPAAAWGAVGKAHRADLTQWPVRRPFVDLVDFLKFPSSPLSHRAAAGFLKRARKGSLRFVDGFLEDVERHVEQLV